MEWHELWAGQLQEYADREVFTAKIVAVFSAYYHAYQSKPAFRRIHIEELVKAAEQQGYTPDRLYKIFCSGNIPADLNALIRDLAQRWPSSGATIEAGQEDLLLLPGGEKDEVG